MKYLKKVIAFPTELEDSVLYYSTEMDKVAIKPKPIEWVLDPSRYIYEDGKYYEYWYDPTQRQVVEDNKLTMELDYGDGKDTLYRDSSLDIVIDNVQWYGYSNSGLDWYEITTRNTSGTYLAELCKYADKGTTNFDDETADVTLYYGTIIVDGKTKKGKELQGTIVTYGDGTVKIFNIVGEISGQTGGDEIFPTDQIDDVENAVSIEIDSTVTSISSYAFYECSSLTSVTIPNSVTSIGNSAFKECSSLTKVVFNEGLISIGHYAFQGVTFKPNSVITIPSTIQNIGQCALHIGATWTEETHGWVLTPTIKYNGTKDELRAKSGGCGEENEKHGDTVQCTDGEIKWEFPQCE